MISHKYDKYIISWVNEFLNERNFDKTTFNKTSTESTLFADDFAAHDVSC